MNLKSNDSPKYKVSQFTGSTLEKPLQFGVVASIFLFEYPIVRNVLNTIGVVSIIQFN